MLRRVAALLLYSDAMRLHFLHVQSSFFGTHFDGLYLVSPGPAKFLRLDSKLVASLRARLRYDRSRLATSLLSRRFKPLDDESVDTSCYYCSRDLGLIYDDTLEHLLFTCCRTRLVAQRFVSTIRLFGVHSILEIMNLVLGSPPLLRSVVIDHVLRLSGSFLVELHRLRQF